MSDQKERLQKFLARAGVASRRAAEELILAGRIRVNGVVVRTLGTSVDPLTDRVDFDSEQVSADVRMVYLLVNKPPGMISAAADPEGRPIVTSLAPPDYGRLYPVGRLDWASEGALLLTNDGELANLLTHPRHEVAKTYMVKIAGLVGDQDPRIRTLRNGVQLDDGTVTLPTEIVRDGDTGKHTWFVIALREGKNRQIRRMFEAVGISVLRLQRIAYGPVVMGNLPLGAFRRLSETEIEELYEAGGSRRPTLAASRGRLPTSQRQAVARRARQAKGPALEAAKKGPQKRSDSRPGQRSDSRPDSRGGSRPDNRGSSRPDSRPGQRSDSRPDSRGGSRPDSRGSSRPDSRPGQRSDSRPGQRSDSRPDSRGSSRPDNRGSSRPDSRGSSRPDSRAGTRGSSRNDTRGGSKSGPRGGRK